MGKLTMQRRPRGFTLIEMLGVIFIIALLMSLAFPFLSVVRKNARRTRAHQQAQQAARAWSAYLLDETAWPDHSDFQQPGPVPMSSEICGILNENRGYLELSEEEEETGYLDSWGVVARRNSPNTSDYEKWQIRVAFDHDYDGYCTYEGPDGNVDIRQSVIAWSVGPDGESGTEDDIITWRRKEDD